jgi:two-component system chemotaxis response regulator CheY
MRKIIIRSLNAVGISSVVEAADGSQAVASFKPGTFDLVLTDWNMPGKSGLEVIKEIRAQDAKVPIIMITTEAEKGRVIQAIQAGVTDYLVKPFTAETLREKLGRHIAVTTQPRATADRVDEENHVPPVEGGRCQDRGSAGDH